MKEISTKCLFMLIALFLWQADAENISIKAGSDNRVFQGWGTSICWWGNIVGNYPEKTRDSIFALVFDTASGLGLNIIRYNIGGGDAPSHNHMGVGKEMEGFLSGASADFDWTKDAGQRRVVMAAKERIPAKCFVAEAFSNAPPWWMTESGCASGGSNSANNLKNDQYAQFAEYLTEVVKHFRDEWGVTFATLEPFNEPMGDWWNANGGQEGCTFSRANQMKLIKEVHAKLAAKQLTTEIAAADEAGYDDAVATWNAYDSLTRAMVYQINTHGYSGSKRTELRRLADRDNKQLWSSEIDGSGAPAPFDKWKHDHTDFAPALDLAQRVIRDMRDLKPDGWIFWQVVESEQAQISLDKNWGCIHADYTGGNKFTVCRKFHALRQFTAFVRPGSRLVDCSSPEAAAFLSADGGNVVVVVRNASASPVTHTMSFDGVKVVAAAAKAYRSSATESVVQLDDIPLSGSTLQMTAKAQSITTCRIGIENRTGADAPVPPGYGLKSYHADVKISRTLRGGVVVDNRSAQTAVVSFYDCRGTRLKTVAAPPLECMTCAVRGAPQVLFADITVAGSSIGHPAVSVCWTR